MRTLLIDNYDSFTYNLYQLISKVNGIEPAVVRNDEVGSIEELGLDGFDNIVISPGPGRPDIPRDFGISAELIARADLPLLGVCLGHQGIVIAAGGAVIAAPQARHGYPDRVTHDGRELFAGVPQDFSAVRYHSLCAARPLPEVLEVTATAPDGVIMGVRHRTRPQWGVQFHPESISSEHGELLLRNFADLTVEWQRRHGVSPRAGDTAMAAPIGAGTSVVAAPVRYRVEQRVIERAVDAEAVFDALYSASPHAFWLDSEHVEPGLDRFSFLGDASGPLAEVVRYRVGSGHVVIESAGGRREVPGGVLDYLSGELRRRDIDFPDVPFDFAGGYVGYLGYEMKADCGALAVHRAPTPDAQWIFADRLIVVDHEAGRTHLLALSEPESAGAAQDWLAATEAIVETLPTWENPPPLELHLDEAAVAPYLTRGRARYLADVAACQEQLLAGESYEICLTDSAYPPGDADGLTVYRTLRRSNPAPYAAFLRFTDLEVACSSPERFLKVDRSRTVESKPIKGTAPRGRTPAEDADLAAELARNPKTRAENLMIVDLLRNDLGRVCEIGSVHVPHLMAVETYTTLHQLVSTVRGALRPGLTPLDALRACFPGGSMTGAPKLRTLEIIDALETEARGIYSGTIGFLGLGGTADLNIVIRTAVRHDNRWRIGAGGAVVLDSDPADEYHEMVWKAAAALRALPGMGTAVPLSSHR
ncbi:aminodeoxychorismate synthase component I [Nocardia sp. ET3-3]|uniref:aminodeoxychorismate synthase n=1 Tax=Nocardia terrae TaxID=2675851 RepID=A0A7K1VAB4_9NOCA|nr:aminodeoxychorismate synthase component I [Nocardia terrae]MVU83389.1 aminodeoxychorismate synthase component I [Nocardia terrae]